MEGTFANGSAFGGTPAQEIYRTNKRWLVRDERLRSQ